MAERFEAGHALIIGVGADLPNTIDDAEGIANILKDSERCAYPETHVRLLTGSDATRNDILDAFEKLAQQSNADSTVIVYFSGHGYRIQTITGASYHLMPHGYDVKQLAKTAISGDEFAGLLRRVPAKKLLVLLDCCHAGGLDATPREELPGAEMAKAAIPDEALAFLQEGRGRMFVVSSTGDELSYAGTPYSAFTRAILESLCGRGLAKQDGFVRVTDLALYAREVVPRRTRDRQHPIMNFREADNFPVAYYAGGDPVPKALPFPEETVPPVDPAARPTLEDRDLFSRPGWNVQGETINNIAGNQAIARGNRSVAVGGNVTNGTIITGDGNKVDQSRYGGSKYHISGGQQGAVGDGARVDHLAMSAGTEKNSVSPIEAISRLVQAAQEAADPALPEHLVALGYIRAASAAAANGEMARAGELLRSSGSWTISLVGSLGDASTIIADILKA